MIHMKMRHDIRGNGNGDNYTWLADNYWWKYIYKLNTFWPWNNRVFFPVHYLNCIKKDILILKHFCVPLTIPDYQSNSENLIQV